MNRADAEEFTQSLGQIVGGSYRQIRLAERLGVPKALGMSTEAWVNQRLGGYVKLSAAQRLDAIKELQAEGANNSDAARALGVDESTVRADLDKLGKSRKRKANSEGNQEPAERTSGNPEPLDLVSTLAADKKLRSTAEATATRKATESASKVRLQAAEDAGLPLGIYQEDFFTGATADRIADESVQLVFTDPPYDRDSAKLYGKAARVAARILKPGGSFVAYSGQKYLPDVYGWINQPALRYWWTFALAHNSGDNQLLQKLGVRCAWKPLVWYVKGTRGDVAEVLADVLQGAGREKSDHPWQQAEAEAAYFIEKLTPPGGLVVDFFLGSGTTKIAADKLGRRFIGFEIDPETAAKAAARIREAA